MIKMRAMFEKKKQTLAASIATRKRLRKYISACAYDFMSKSGCDVNHIMINSVELNAT